MKKWNNTIKFTGITFLIGIFLVKVSETNASGNLGKVSIISILCVVGLGTSFTTFNLLSSYTILSILPWFSKKTAVTLSVLSCIRVIGLAATVIDVLPESSGDKGLLMVPMVFVYLATLLILNGFVHIVKVKNEPEEETPSEQKEQEENKDNVIVESNVNSKINEVAIFTIYTDEVSVKDEKL